MAAHLVCRRRSPHTSIPPTLICMGDAAVICTGAAAVVCIGGAAVSCAGSPQRRAWEPRPSNPHRYSHSAVRPGGGRPALPDGGGHPNNAALCSPSQLYGTPKRSPLRLCRPAGEHVAVFCMGALYTVILLILSKSTIWKNEFGNGILLYFFLWGGVAGAFPTEFQLEIAGEGSAREANNCSYANLG